MGACCTPSFGYTIGPEIGAGSFGTVYHAVCRRSGEAYAIKVVPTDVGKHLPTESVMTEVEILKQLHHDNLLRLVDFYHDQQRVCIVTEAFCGGALLERLQDSQSESSAVAVARQMCEGLAHLAQLRIVHCDVKPDNFMFRRPAPDLALVLLDFGLAQQVQGEPLTHACGTLHYCAPEVLRRSFGVPADVWSAGVILFLVIYGRYPFSCDSPQAVVSGIAFEQPDWHDASYSVTATSSPAACSRARGSAARGRVARDRVSSPSAASPQKDENG